jgi:hypothetical protein
MSEPRTRFDEADAARLAEGQRLAHPGGRRAGAANAGSRLAASPMRLAPLSRRPVTGRTGARRA